LLFGFDRANDNEDVGFLRLDVFRFGVSFCLLGFFLVDELVVARSDVLRVFLGCFLLEVAGIER
jgi:hypothetical protein